jgi:hypothetical protein
MFDQLLIVPNLRSEGGGGKGRSVQSWVSGGRDGRVPHISLVQPISSSRVLCPLGKSNQTKRRNICRRSSCLARSRNFFAPVKRERKVSKMIRVFLLCLFRIDCETISRYTPLFTSSSETSNPTIPSRCIFTWREMGMNDLHMELR